MVRSVWIRSVLLGALLLALIATSGCSLLSAAPSAPWPPSDTGRPVFYYFGDPG